MSQETIDISAMDMENSLSGLSELQTLLDTHIQKGSALSESVLFPSEKRSRWQSIGNPEVIYRSPYDLRREAHGIDCLKSEIRGHIALTILEISVRIDFIRFYMRNEMGVTDVPVSHAIMLPLRIAGLVDGAISIVDFLYEDFPKILEYFGNAG